MPIVNGFWVEPTHAPYVPPPEDEGGGPQTVYVQTTDPGAVGAGKMWVDTSGDPARVLKRNGDDDNWFELIGSYVSIDGIYLLADQAAISLQRKDAGAVVRSELSMTEGRTDIHARDVDGTLITTWEVGEDGFGATVYDELLNARALHLAQAGASDDTDAAWEWTVKDVVGTDKAKLTLDETGVHLEAVNVFLDALPTSDPAVAGALWNDTGTLKVSAG